MNSTSQGLLVCFLLLTVCEFSGGQYGSSSPTPRTSPNTRTRSTANYGAGTETQSPPRAPVVEVNFIQYPPNRAYLDLCGEGKETKVSAIKSAKDPLAASVEQLFSKRCTECHYKGSTDGSNKFQDILDVPEMIAKGILSPRNVGGSLLNTVLQKDRMPLSGDPLSADEKKFVTQWIEKGAPSFTESPGIDVGFISETDRNQCLRKDLASLSPSVRPFQRYLTLTHLYNSGRGAEINRVTQAIVKLLNSLSWERSLRGVRAIDATATLLRLDIRDFGWKESTWEKVAGQNPYGASEGNISLRGDWFVFVASRPPLYHDILELPGADGKNGADTALERLLGVEVDANIRSGEAKRAGTRQSGVSLHNRIIERHFAPRGSYWKSYDFETSEGKQNIFDHPLDFQKNGGEIIFSLPNGLHGYMLTDAKGKRLDSAPVTIVQHKKRPEGGFAVLNGLSCFECHTAGMNRVADQIRPHVQAQPGAFSRGEAQQILRLFPEKERMEALFLEDEKQYRKAIEGAGINFKAKEEPIFATSQKFDSALDEATAAAELGVKLEDFKGIVSRSANLQRRLALSAAFSVDRLTFDREFKEIVSAFQREAPAKPRRSEYRSSEGVPIAFKEVSGSFIMGSPPNELGRRDDERQLTINGLAPFQIQTTEVTQLQWREVMGSIPVQPRDGDLFPVVNVSWQDAQVFLSEMNKQQLATGFFYRLPKEAEWELSARAGQKTAYSFGDDVLKLGEFAWFDENSGGKPQAVGTKAPNAFGLYDMHGNVFEWVEEVYAGSGKTEERVVRGGSWLSGAARCRSANRGGEGPDQKRDFIGFRLVRVKR